MLLLFHSPWQQNAVWDDSARHRFSSALIHESCFCLRFAEALCSTCSIPSPLFSCCFWLGYCNSCLNPFIYASTSREFKRAFSKILCGRRGTSNGAGGRSTNYQQHQLLPPRNSVGNVSPALGAKDAATTRRPVHSTGDQCATATWSSRRRKQKERWRRKRKNEISGAIQMFASSSLPSFQSDTRRRLVKSTGACVLTNRCWWDIAMPQARRTRSSSWAEPLLLLFACMCTRPLKTPALKKKSSILLGVRLFLNWRSSLQMGRPSSNCHCKPGGRLWLWEYSPWWCRCSAKKMETQKESRFRTNWCRSIERYGRGKRSTTRHRLREGSNGRAINRFGFRSEKINMKLPSAVLTWSTTRSGNDKWRELDAVIPQIGWRRQHAADE